MTTLLEHVKHHMIANGLGRDERTQPTVGVPPAEEPTLWLAPRNGTPAPGESMGSQVQANPDLVVGLFQVAGIAPPRHEGFRRIDGLQLWMRARKEPFVREWEVRFRAEFNDKRGWELADGYPINESLLFRDVQPVGSGEQGYDFTMEYLIEHWVDGAP
jgi:hypothetical protein